ncbi:alpha-glucosidase [Carnobacterium viridans]|uniref:Alpha-glucosidase n=1 Tax=Carnobacterium viridans TaxID=174587 RepID=A0A1H0YAS8_9LACT|nr:alpha-glucosidase [Carnobacterium viridans]UDE95241.1 alpha-glucosidase [Carnobacterium viridans]SDQ12294.1 alpha-glucosidase [Carnobacterium viridans]
MKKMDWWKEAIVYQVYPRSFKDTNEDGIGDLKGIISRLDYIQQLGVTAIWLNPIFTSPQVDNGYDVSDYYTIDPIFGTIADAVELIKEAHKRNLKVIFDLVVNHTSDQHIWFKEALKGPENPYRNFYIWEDAKKGGHLPNNWVSVFGGSVWEKEPVGDQYYFHLFKKEMPDLNWDNPEVEKAILDVGKFWLDHGVDGFRLDAFIHMDKADDFFQVEMENGQELVSAQKINAYLPNIKNYVQKLSMDLRKVKEDVFILGEAASANVDLAFKYTHPENEMCNAIISFMIFPEDESMKDPRLPFNMQSSRLNKKAFKEVMTEWQDKMDPFGGPVLYWNNHDMARVVSRFGNVEQYRDNSSKMLATLMYLQKGIPFIFNGEEIGMRNLHYSDRAHFDTPGAVPFYEKAKQLGYSEKHILKELNHAGRDVSRGAMQWDSSEFAGFSKVSPWSGVNVEKNYNVADQEKDPNSILAYYKKVLLLKKLPVFTKGTFILQDTKDTLYVYERNYEGQRAIVCCNLSDTQEHIQEDGISTSGWEVILQNEGNTIDKDSVTFAPYGTIVFMCENLVADETAEKE